MNPYVKLAKNAINEFVKNGKVLKLSDDLPKEILEKRAGTFVSIHTKRGLTRNDNTTRIDAEGELRGCIGTILPTKSCVAEEIIDNAISACSRDYRFSPVTRDELDDLEISVDVLGEPEPIQSLANLEPQKYGVIVKTDDGRSGLLLPDLEGVDSPELQIAIARQKAGITPSEPVYLYRFEVTRYKE